ARGAPGRRPRRRFASRSVSARARPVLPCSCHCVDAGYVPLGRVMYATLAMAAAVMRAVITEHSLVRRGTTPPYQGAPEATLVRKDEAVSQLDETVPSGCRDRLAAVRAAELAEDRRDVRSDGVDRGLLIIRDR